VITITIAVTVATKANSVIPNTSVAVARNSLARTLNVSASSSAAMAKMIAVTIRTKLDVVSMIRL